MNSHICLHTHTRTHCLRVSEYFLAYSSFVLSSLLSVKDTLTLAELDSDIPALTFTSAHRKKVGQILLSLAICRLLKWQWLSHEDAAEVTIKYPCAHFHGCSSHGKFDIARHGFEMRCNLVLHLQMEVFSWLVSHNCFLLGPSVPVCFFFWFMIYAL